MKEIGVKVVRINYKKSHMSMCVFLPDSYDGLAKLEENMVKFNYTKILRRIEEANVELSLPKFEIGYDMSLKKTLKHVRMCCKYLQYLKLHYSVPVPKFSSNILTTNFIAWIESYIR